MDLAERVGLQLKRLRVERGLSLSELARRSMVGKGTLSELEAGRRNPTLETLYALTTALGIPLSAVLPREPAGAEISGGAVDAVLLERFEDAETVTEVFRIRIRSGAVQRSAAHTPGTREHIIVMQGHAHVGESSSPLVVGPGDHGSWAADVPHVYRAASQDVEAVLSVHYRKAAARETAPDPADRPRATAQPVTTPRPR
jgi:transcriptional regulator with XRE-family HTH domain